MEHWDEVRTAYQVAKHGTVSGAAHMLGVHHATVIRHVDALEERLGIKLFQRHARGYTPTEAGEDLLRVAQTTEDQFSQLEGRIKGRGMDMTGELVITSLIGLAPLMAPVLAGFQRDHPGVILRYLTGERLFRLEYGEAHVALRAGSVPQEPDNVVQKLCDMDVALYASQSYVEAHGIPTKDAQFKEHRFVGHDNINSRAPFLQWMNQAIPRENVVLRSTDNRAVELAVLAGAGIGFLSPQDAAGHDDLIQIAPPREEWRAPLWLVTHVDLHRTPKVQSFLAALKEAAKSWGNL